MQWTCDVIMQWTLEEREKRMRNLEFYVCKHVVKDLLILVEAFPALSLHRVMGQGTPPVIFLARYCDSSFCDLVYESFLVLSLKYFHNRLRKQGRKTVKRALHFIDRGINQIFEYQVNTFTSSFSVNIFSFKCYQSVLIFSDLRQ